MSKTIGIYKITSPSGYLYIGQSRNIEHRKRQYKHDQAKKQHRLHNSIAKHGWDAHKFEVIHEFNKNTVTQDHLNYAECFYMAHYRMLGYELMNIKEGGNNGPLPEETKEKMRQSAIGRKMSPESRAKMSVTRKGRKWTEEQRIKIMNNKTILRGEAHPFYGRKLSPEHVAKLIGRNKGVPRPPEVREKISKAHSKPVMCIETGVVFSSCEEAARQMFDNYKIGCKIGAVCNGKRLSCKGYTFKRI